MCSIKIGASFCQKVELYIFGCLEESLLLQTSIHLFS